MVNVETGQALARCSARPEVGRKLESEARQAITRTKGVGLQGKAAGAWVEKSLLIVCLLSGKRGGQDVAARRLDQWKMYR